MSNQPPQLTPDDLKAWDTYAAAAINGMFTSGMTIDGCVGSPKLYASMATRVADELIESRKQREVNP
jgi:hypothetical protein